MRRARMKPNHPDFICLIDTRIKPLMRNNKMPGTYTDATKFLSDIFGKLPLEGINVSPKLKKKPREITLFWRGK